MILTLIILFVIGYLLIAFEHTLNINKATFAMLLCGVLWSVYVAMGGAVSHMDLVEHLGDTCEVVVFLICAMTIVEHIDRYGGFNFITEHINAGNKKQLMWILAALSFIMSAVLDNMTTTIIMVMMTRRLLSDQKERWLFAGVIVVAANSGGAWSPIGDVTTIMLWMADKVTTSSLILNLVVPSIVSVAIPVFIASHWVKEGTIMKTKSSNVVANELAETYPNLSKWMLVLGVSALLFVPLFKTLTGLPPFMGMIISLGFVWLVTEIIVNRLHIDKKLGGRVSHTVRKIDMPSILFFLGILMAVAALQQAGVLTMVADGMNTHLHEPFAMATIIGFLSSIVDNVPLVAACIKMFANVDAIAVVDPVYARYFIEDGLFWHLLTFTAGVGGSLLIIGSAAGVVAMGIEKIPFFWYLKRISFIAMLGYLAGIGVIALEYYFMPFLQ